MTRKTYAARLAQQVLQNFGLTAPPVDPGLVANRLGAEVIRKPDSANKNSGLIGRHGDRVIIGVNALHPAVRQRFTIAHEIGHMLLHADQPLIIDQSGGAIIGTRQEGDDSPREIEANAFAASLLMPADWVKKELKRRQLPNADDNDAAVSSLARTFGVSQQAMMYRLVNLGYLRNF